MLSVPPSFLHPYFDKRVYNVTAGASKAKFLEFDTNRVYLEFIRQTNNFPATTVWVDTLGTINSAGGWAMTGAGENVRFKYHDSTVLLAGEWFLISPAGNETIRVIEIVFRPDRPSGKNGGPSNGRSNS